MFLSNCNIEMEKIFVKKACYKGTEVNENYRNKVLIEIIKLFFKNLIESVRELGFISENGY